MPPLVPKSVLQQYFETGDKPSAAQFGSLIYSMVNILDDRYLLGLRAYDPLKQYLVGDTAIYANALYECIADTTGTFNPPSWDVIASLGSVVYAGTWQAKLTENIPPLSSGSGTKGFYYVVTDADADPNNNVNLDGINDWRIGDWAIFNGTVWQIVRNSEAPTKAQDVIFIPTTSIISTNVQDAIEEVESNLETGLATKQDELSLTPNYFPYASGPNTLSDGAISGESDGVALKNGSVFRSATAGKAQLGFTASGDKVILSTDGGKGGESTLTLESTLLKLERNHYGLLSMTSGADGTGDVELTNGAFNGLSITSSVVQLINKKTNNFLKLNNTGLSEIASDILKVSAIVNLPGLTPSTVPVLNGGQNLTSSGVTSTELGYLSGVTSSLQSQIDGKVDLSGDTMTGDLILNADPSVALGAATKQYVDAVQTNVNTKVSISGDTMTGFLTLSADPTANLHAVTKQYSDTKVAKSGDTMTGFLTLSADPTANLHAVTKQYSDTKVAKSGSTMTGDLILNADPTVSLGAATKQYVDAVQTNVNNKVSISGDTMTGFLTLSADPTANLHAVTKQYSDTKVAKSGSTMTGALILSGNPTLDFGAATKIYVDNGLATKLNLSGGTMTGAITLPGDPSSALQAATKQYVDSKVSSAGTIALPFTFGGVYGTTSSSFGRIPLQITVPALGSTMTAVLVVDYLTEGGSTGEAAIMDWTASTVTVTAVSGSNTSLADSAGAWLKTQTSTPFTITANKTYQVLLRRVTGSGNNQAQIESATLFITYS